MHFKLLRVAIYTLVAVVLLGAAALGGGGWFYAGEIKNGALVVGHDEDLPDMQVAAIGEGQVTLLVTPETDEDGDWRSPGIWGLKRDNGYDQVGAILQVTDEQVVREYTPLSGDLSIGDMVRLDSYAFPADPLEAHDLPFEEVSFSSPLGEFQAWLVTGDSRTWAIFVHGRGASRREALRMLPTVAEQGLSSLIITYRNDEGVPANPDGYHWFGQTEWKDLEGAAQYALDHGAEELILVGYSMGGGIVASFLYQSPLADKVRGVILDAPMLDLSATVDHGADQRGIPVVGLPLPELLAEVAKVISSIRFGIDFEALDYLSRAEQLSARILLIQGDADKAVPVSTSDALAKARPDIVEYVRNPNVGHVRSWNSGGAAYEREVRDFLRGLTE